MDPVQQSKKNWLSKGEAPLLPPRPSLTLKKVLLCVWWNISGVIHYELLKPGQTITAEVYCDQLDKLNSTRFCRKDLRKRTKLFCNICNEPVCLKHRLEQKKIK